LTGDHPQALVCQVGTLRLFILIERCLLAFQPIRSLDLKILSRSLIWLTL